MDPLHRALLRWAGRDPVLIQLRGLVRFGHVLTEQERREVEAALAGRVRAGPAEDRPAIGEGDRP